MTLLRRVAAIALIVMGLGFAWVLLRGGSTVVESDDGAIGVRNATVVAPPTPAATPSAVPVPTPSPIPSPTPIPTFTPVPTATPVPYREAVLAFTGDLLSHSAVYNAAGAYGTEPDWDYDYRPMFAEVAPQLRVADFAICGMETPISADNTDLATYPQFRAPRELADAVADAGWDACSTATNHSLDQRVDGLVTTLDQLDRAGVQHTGMARTEEEFLTPRLYDVNGISIGHLSWTYGFNGLRRPDGSSFVANLINVGDILEDAARARAAGADVIVLAMHWGDEYVTNPSSYQTSLAAELTASDNVDLIIGMHAHVVQPIEMVNDKLVVFGLGNFLANQGHRDARRAEGVIVEVQIGGTDDGGYAVTDVAATPTMVDLNDFTVLPLPQLLAAIDADPQHRRAGQRDVLANAQDRVMQAINRRGIDLLPGPL